MLSQMAIFFCFHKTDFYNHYRKLICMPLYNRGEKERL